MKKFIIAIMMLVMLVLAGCSDTSVDKEKHPDGGIVVFVGFDKAIYFIIENEEAITRDSSYGYTAITYGEDKTFTTNDLYYMYPFHDRKELNVLLKQFGHEEIK